MRINSIDFPDEMIESIQNKELVIFAGAGVSMGKPTCLPDFAKLTRLIAKDTQHKLGRRKDYEVFLGELKDNFGSGDGPNVNKLAADILIKKCKSPNHLHKAIIDLFEHPTDIKIVTTNYDQMLETASRDMGISLPVFDAPALPLGSDLSGVVHLHGNVNNHKYIVLTDEDFGKAYLTDGYASRFLVQLFTKYDVLFIGYSLKDIVLSYLTKAMSRVSQRNKYILTDKENNKYKSLGIIPILYPENRHDTMTEAVELLGKQVRMSTLQWNTFFDDIKDNPPKDLTNESIISYCIKDYNKTQLMMQKISGKSWITALNERNIFQNLFIRDVELSKEDLLWVGWLSKNLICNDVDILLDLFATHNNIINKQFSDTLVVNIIGNEKNISDEVLQIQVALLIDYITEDYMLYGLMDVAYRRHLTTLYWTLYKKAFKVKLLCDKRYLFSEHTIITHKISSDAYSLSKYWKQCEAELIESYSISILRFCVEFIDSLHNDYVLIGEADHNKEPWKVSIYPLEVKDASYFFDGLYVLGDIFLSSSIKAQKANPNALKGILDECLKSDSIFLRKLALRSIRETKVYTPNQKLKMIEENDFLSSSSEIQQTKCLVCSIFDELSHEKQMNLLLKIEEIAAEDNFENSKIVYSYFCAIKRKCQTNQYVNSKIDLLDKKYDFTSFFHPTPPPVDERFHMVSKDIKGLSESKLKDFFAFVNSNKEGFYISELMDEITKAFSEEFYWSYKALKLLLTLRISEEMLWNHILYGIEKLSLAPDEYYVLLQLIVDPVVIEKNTKAVSMVLLNMLRLSGHESFFKDHEEDINSIFSKLWDYKKIEESGIDVLQQSMNSSLGILLNCCIFMIDKHKERCIPERYKTLLIESLSMKGQEYYVSLCIIAGHYGFFHYRDAEWCNKMFNPALSGELSEEEYIYSWDGFVLYTGGLSVDNVDDLKRVFLKAIEKIGLLSLDAHYRFIDLYVTLLFNAVKHPNAYYIPRFYLYASDDDKRYFVSVIGHRFEKMDAEKKMRQWEKWIKRHLANRTINKPVKPIELELQEYLEWLPHLREVYDAAVDIMCKGLLPKKIGILFFDDLIKSNLPETNPESTCRLLISLCKSGSKSEWNDGSIKKIKNMMSTLPTKESQILDNELVKNGWINI